MALIADICSRGLKADVCKVADSGIIHAYEDAVVSDVASVDFTSNNADSFGHEDHKFIRFGKNIGTVTRNPFGCAILGTNVMGVSCTDRNVPQGTELVVLTDTIGFFLYDGADTVEYLIDDSIICDESVSIDDNKGMTDSASMSDVADIDFGKNATDDAVLDDIGSVLFEKIVRCRPDSNSIGSFVVGSRLIGSNWNTEQPDCPIYVSDHVSYINFADPNLTIESPTDNFGFSDSVGYHFSVGIIDDVGTNDNTNPGFYENELDVITLTDDPIARIGLHRLVEDTIQPIYDSPVEYENKGLSGDEAEMTDIVSVVFMKYGTVGTQILGTEILG